MVKLYDRYSFAFIEDLPFAPAVTVAVVQTIAAALILISPVLSPSAPVRVWLDRGAALVLLAVLAAMLPIAQVGEWEYRPDPVDAAWAVKLRLLLACALTTILLAPGRMRLTSV